MRRDESIKVVLATRSMLPGMNIPRWSALISQALIANEPGYEQEIFRICTPMEGKLRPKIFYVMDGDVGPAWGCFHVCKRTLMNTDFGFVHTKKYQAFANPVVNRL